MILVTYLLKESEIVIEQLSYDFRGVPRRRKVEVRRIPYHTQDLLTNFATNPADYPLIRPPKKHRFSGPGQDDSFDNVDIESTQNNILLARSSFLLRNW